MQLLMRRSLPQQFANRFAVGKNRQRAAGVIEKSAPLIHAEELIHGGHQVARPQRPVFGCLSLRGKRNRDCTTEST
jgi:hypothetical protein